MRLFHLIISLSSGHRPHLLNLAILMTIEVSIAIVILTAKIAMVIGYLKEGAVSNQLITTYV